MHLRSLNICIILINYDTHEAYERNAHTYIHRYTHAGTYINTNQVFLITNVTFSGMGKYSHRVVFPLDLDLHFSRFKIK